MYFKPVLGEDEDKWRGEGGAEDMASKLEGHQQLAVRQVVDERAARRRNERHTLAAGFVRFLGYIYIELDWYSG